MVLPVVVCAIVLGTLAGTQDWAPSCTGSFQCSSLQVDSNCAEIYVPRQWGSVRPFARRGPNDWVGCKYGHVETDGVCAKACDGTVRSAPCRCQTEDEAEADAREGALSSLWISFGLLVLGSTVSFFLYWGTLCCWARCRSSAECVGEAAAAREDPSEEQQQPQTGDGVSIEEDCGVVEGTPETPPTKPTLRMHARRLIAQSARFCVEHEALCTILSLVVMLAVLVVPVYDQEIRRPEDHGEFHEFFGRFISVVAIVAVACTILGSLITFSRQRSAWLHMHCATLVMLPAIGLVGMIWSLARVSSPAGIYHACEISHCIFNLC